MTTAPILRPGRPAAMILAVWALVTIWSYPAIADSVTCPADLNRDFQVDGADLLEVLSQWGDCSDTNDCLADFNGDGEVDGADLLILLSAWGECPLEGGCVGYCGGQSPYGWCDDKCVAFGDCVWNACVACDIPDCELLDEDSCQYRCGGIAPSGCWCDEACRKFDDCCDDYCEYCESVSTTCP